MDISSSVMSSEAVKTLDRSWSEFLDASAQWNRGEISGGELIAISDRLQQIRAALGLVSE